MILAGACALSGGTFAGSPAVAGMPADIPVDLYIPGCPPHPLTTLDGLLRLLGRIEKECPVEKRRIKGQSFTTENAESTEEGQKKWH